MVHILIEGGANPNLDVCLLDESQPFNLLILMFLKPGKVDGRIRIDWSESGDRIWLYNPFLHRLCSLARPPAGCEDADPEFIGDKLRFYRGARFEYSFSGDEYEINFGGDISAVKT